MAMAITVAGISAFIPRVAANERLSGKQGPTGRRAPQVVASDLGLKLHRREALSAFVLSIASIAGHGSSATSPSKDTHLPIHKIKEIVENDIRNGQYYVTGDLTRTIYDDNCRFVDPTTDIRGVDKYVAAVRALFDPKTSHHELISIDLTSRQTIQAKWRLEGYIKAPWHPHISPYEGTTIYRVDDNGLIASHEETWDIPVWKAFLEFLTPSLNA